MSTRTAKWLSITTALVFTFCFQGQTQAQRGFRIGNAFAAGGGQGFRLGGPRAGMQFGGGQGATIGGQYYGMRFGNGQGARIGGQNYGFQAGGRQGTQVGRFAFPNNNVARGGYYNGNRGQYQQRIAVYPNNNYVRRAPVCYQQNLRVPQQQQPLVARQQPLVAAQQPLVAAQQPFVAQPLVVGQQFLVAPLRQNLVAAPQQVGIGLQNPLLQTSGQVVPNPVTLATTPAAVPNGIETQTNLELSPAQTLQLPETNTEPFLDILPETPIPANETLEPVTDDLEDEFLDPVLDAPESTPAANSILNKELEVDAPPIDTDSLSPGLDLDFDGS